MGTIIMATVEKVETYLLSGLLIHELKQEVTIDRMEKVFKQLGVEFNPKIAELCCLSGDKFESYYKLVTATPVAAAPSAASVAVQEEEKPKQAEKEADADIDLFDDDLFG